MSVPSLGFLGVFLGVLSVLAVNIYFFVSATRNNPASAAFVHMPQPSLAATVGRHPATSEIGPGIGLPVTWLYKTSGSKSTPFGQTIVPMSAFTSTRAK